MLYSAKPHNLAVTNGRFLLSARGAGLRRGRELVLQENKGVF